MSTRIKTFIGFSVKSGKIIYGVDNITSSRKRIYIILFDGELSDRSKKVLEKFVQGKKIGMYPLNIGEYLPDRNIKENEIKEKSVNE